MLKTIIAVIIGLTYFFTRLSDVKKKTKKFWITTTIIAILIFLAPYLETLHENNIQYAKEQLMAGGLYPELLLIKKQIINKKGVDISSVERYFQGNQYLSGNIHIQMSNLLVSVKDGNYAAAEQQVDDLISKIGNKYGYYVSPIQVNSASKLSADVLKPHDAR